MATWACLLSLINCGNTLIMVNYEHLNYLKTHLQATKLLIQVNAVFFLNQKVHYSCEPTKNG